MANTLVKLVHKHVRTLAWDFFGASLLPEQCGGVPGKGTDMIPHGLRMFMSAAQQQKVPAVVGSLDLKSAFYATIKEMALRLPGDEERLQ
eukprot:2841104-Pyramimonas_sp.AAC.1